MFFFLSLSLFLSFSILFSTTKPATNNPEYLDLLPDFLICRLISTLIISYRAVADYYCL